jgi:phosphoglycolate phosphatase-like HAD superfamily hydrolase
MLARRYGTVTIVRLCVFDLDHTLVRSPLDLAAMAVDIRALIETRCGPLPARPDRYRVGELIAHCKAHLPHMEADAWEVALDHERRAMLEASLEPGAPEAVRGARAAGFATALWTNNAGDISRGALERFGIAGDLDLIVTRDEMRDLKPDPDGWRVITAHFGAVQEAFVVGDSWVDGLAAAKAGVPFVAYRPREDDLARWGVTPVARLTDLAALPAWLATRPGR